MEPVDRYLEVNGIRLHYLEWGTPDFEPLLLLHGFMGHAHMWDNIAPVLAERYRVLALDQRGHGESEWPKDASYSIYDHFMDLSGFVEALDLNDLNVVGHSMGGRNALFYAACSDQNRIKKLALVDARPGNNPKGSKALKEFVLSLPLRIRFVEEAARVFKRLYPYLSEDFCNHVVRYGFKEAGDGTLVPRHDVRMNRLSEGTDFEAEELWPFLGNITCPTMVIRGEDSPFLSRSEAERMSLCMPKADFREIPRSTHLPAQENPESFLEVVMCFLGSSNHSF
jgi:pimeloyl-ACP methyl ester carboxylesterase